MPISVLAPPILNRDLHVSEIPMLSECSSEFESSQVIGKILRESGFPSGHVVSV